MKKLLPRSPKSARFGCLLVLGALFAATAIAGVALLIAGWRPTWMLACDEHASRGTCLQVCLREGSGNASCEELASRYLQAEGSERDPLVGHALLAAACRAGNEHSCTLLPKLQASNDAECGPLLRHSTPPPIEALPWVAMALVESRVGCDENDGRSCQRYARLLFNEVGVVPSDHERARALEWLQARCSANVEFACGELGIRLPSTRGRTNAQSVERWRLIRAACERGADDACVPLLEAAAREGLDPQLGELPVATKSRLEERCDRGEVAACQATIHWVERPDQRDKLAAALRSSCEQGDPHGCILLARELAYGSQERLGAWRTACEAGSATACDQASLETKEESLELRDEACELGSLSACSRHLDDLEGVERDELAQALCRAGHRYACHKVALRSPPAERMEWLSRGCSGRNCNDLDDVTAEERLELLRRTCAEGHLCAALWHLARKEVEAAPPACRQRILATACRPPRGADAGELVASLSHRDRLLTGTVREQACRELARIRTQAGETDKQWARDELFKQCAATGPYCDACRMLLDQSTFSLEPVERLVIVGRLCTFGDEDACRELAGQPDAPSRARAALERARSLAGRNEPECGRLSAYRPRALAYGACDLVPAGTPCFSGRAGTGRCLGSDAPWCAPARAGLATRALEVEESQMVTTGSVRSALHQNTPKLGACVDPFLANRDAQPILFDVVATASDAGTRLELSVTPKHSNHGTSGALTTCLQHVLDEELTWFARPLGAQSGPIPRTPTSKFVWTIEVGPGL